MSHIVPSLSPGKPSLKQNNVGVEEKMESRSISPFRVSFEDSRNVRCTDDFNDNNRNETSSNESKESMMTLVQRTKEMSSMIMSDRELLIMKQQALLLVIEKQLDAAQLRLQLEVEGAGQVKLKYNNKYDFHALSLSLSLSFFFLFFSLFLSISLCPIMFYYPCSFH